MRRAIYLVMKKTFQGLAVGLALLGHGLVAAGAAGRADDVLLFTYFTGNGEDGLHLAWSEDGYAWTALNGGRSVLAPRIGSKEKLMRDPCVLRGPDGIFRLVWTSGWWERGIGYASSPDLVHWSGQQEIPVMAHEPTARNAWAPEIAWDDRRHHFMIFWATTIPDRFAATAGSAEDQLNHRLYFTTTEDFRTFAPTRLLYDPGFCVIDATFLHADGRHYLIVKDETLHPPAKNLRLAAAADLEGPFRELSPPFSPPGLWAEGPTAIRVGGDYLVYFDAYRENRFGVLRSADLKTWEDVSIRLKMPGAGTPERVRHGTVIRVPRAMLDGLRPSP